MNQKYKWNQYFDLYKSVPETKKIHSVKVLKNNSIEYRFYSSSTTKKNLLIFKLKTTN